MPVSLVTGGAGFLGSHVAQHCLDLGHSVVVLDDLSGGFWDQVPERATFVRGSVCDADLVRQVFERGRFDYVYHLAAYAAEGMSHFIRRFNYENNVLGSVTLVNEAAQHRVKRFVFTSSIAVYGAQDPPFSEDLPPQPIDPYGIAKHAVELDLAAAQRVFGLDYTIFRPHNVYGEKQNLGDRYRNVVGIFMRQAMAGEPLTIFGDGRQSRAFSYVADVAPSIAQAPLMDGARNETFDIGGDVPYTVLELADVVSAAMGVAPAYEHLPARHEATHAFAGHDKARRAFGFRSQTDLVTGVSRMARWARTMGVRAEGKRVPEIDLNMPPSWR